MIMAHQGFAVIVSQNGWHEAVAFQLHGVGVHDITHFAVNEIIRVQSRIGKRI